MNFIIMLCYARSGGTLLNRLLATTPDTVVLSEVNPLGGGYGALGKESYTTPYEQAKRWYGIDINSRKFADSIEEIYNYCNQHDKNLIIRDWSFVNFTSHKYNDNNPPNAFLTLEVLKPLKPKVFALVRNGIDVWISRGSPHIDNFSKYYLNYVNELIDLQIPIFKYEDLTTTPEIVIEKISKTIKIDFFKTYKKFHKVKNVNGDTQLSKQLTKKIHPPQRKFITPQKIIKIHSSRKLKEANEKLGYNVKYLDRNFISLKDYFRKGLIKLLKKHMFRK